MSPKNELKAEFSHNNLGNGIIAITAPMKEQIYLVLGNKEAMVIDTGMGIGMLRKYIEELTDLPLVVINTHGHPDHAGGNGEFDQVFMHSKDTAVYNKMCTEEFRIGDIRKVFEGPVEAFEENLIPFKKEFEELDHVTSWDLGDRKLDIMLIPGHTPGSICLYDNNSGSLFVGDMVTQTDSWLFLDHSESLETYCNTLYSILNRNWWISQILPGHMPVPISPQMLKDKIICAEQVLIHHECGVPFDTFAGSGFLVQYENARIIYDANKIYNS